MWKTCDNCGKKNELTHRFCVACGFVLNQVQPTNEKESMRNLASSSSPDATKLQVVGHWIRALTGAVIGNDPCESLSSGEVLCDLLNILKPNVVPKINRSRQSFLQLDNVAAFLAGAKSLGVRDHELFSMADLRQKRSPNNVINCVYRLGELAHDLLDFHGPFMVLLNGQDVEEADEFEIPPPPPMEEFRSADTLSTLSSQERMKDLKLLQQQYLDVSGNFRIEIYLCTDRSSLDSIQS